MARSENIPYLTKDRCPRLDTPNLHLSITYFSGDGTATYTISARIKKISGEHIFLDLEQPFGFLAWINGLYKPDKLMLFLDDAHFTVRDIAVL